MLPADAWGQPERFERPHRIIARSGTARETTRRTGAPHVERRVAAHRPRHSRGLGLPVTGKGSAVFFASLYQDLLAAVKADEAASGIVPGDQYWKVALTIGGG